MALELIIISIIIGVYQFFCPSYGMNNQLLLVIALLLGLLTWQLTQGSKENKTAPDITLAILQTANHKALNKVRESFKKEYCKHAKASVCFIEQNGENSISSLQAMATSLHNNEKVALILAIGTPALQAVKQADINAAKSKPIVFAAASDPSAAQIESRTNICGVSDAINPVKLAEIIKKIAPKVSSLAILSNPAEEGSQAQALSISHEMEKRLFSASVIQISSVSEIPTIVGMACRKYDLLIAPNDNLVASSMPLIGYIVNSHNKILIASDLLLYGTGLASAAYGVDYAIIGKIAASMSLEILERNKSPYELGTRTLEASWKQDSSNFKKIGLTPLKV